MGKKKERKPSKEGGSVAWGALVARCFLGSVFLVAGLPKIFDLKAFSASVAAYQLLPPYLVYPVGASLPWFEVLVGLALILGLRSRLASLLLGTLSLFFAAGIVRVINAGLDIDCGCFAVPMKASWGHVLFNLICVALAGWLATVGGGNYALDSRDPAPSAWSWPLFGATAVLLLLSSNLMAFELGRSVATSTSSPPPPNTIPASGAKLVFDRPVLELGELTEGQVLTTTVRYRNAGTSPTRILEVKTSCGCTVPKLTQRELEAGQEGSMEVEYTASSHAGPFERTIRVSYEGGSEPEMIRVVGSVKKTINIEPHFARMTKGQSVTFAMSPMDPKDPGFKVVNVETATTKLKAEVLGFEQGTRTWRFRVTLLGSPTDAEMKRSKAVKIYTDRAKEPFRFHVVMKR